MFRESIHYCVTNSVSSGTYSLSMHCTDTDTYLFVSIRSENLLHQVCIGTGPREFLIPRKSLTLVASLVSLFQTRPPCISFNGMGEKLSVCLISELPAKRRPGTVNNFGADEFERCLSLPTAKIIKRHDFRTIIDFMLMKFRTTLDKIWLQSVPLVHRVVI